jgi:hypothetical protein
MQLINTTKITSEEVILVTLCYPSDAGTKLSTS